MKGKETKKKKEEGRISGSAFYRWMAKKNPKRHCAGKCSVDNAWWQRRVTLFGNEIEDSCVIGNRENREMVHDRRSVTQRVRTC